MGKSNMVLQDLVGRPALYPRIWSGESPPLLSRRSARRRMWAGSFRFVAYTHNRGLPPEPEWSEGKESFARLLAPTGLEAKTEAGRLACDPEASRRQAPGILWHWW